MTTKDFEVLIVVLAASYSTSMDVMAWGRKQDSNIYKKEERGNTNAAKPKTHFCSIYLMTFIFYLVPPLGHNFNLSNSYL